MRGKRNLQITVKEIFYYLFFSLLLFAKGIGLYDGQPLFKVFLVAALLCYGALMALTSFSLRETLIVGGLLLLGGIVYLYSGEKGALLYIMMVTGLKNIPIKRVFTVGLITWGFSFIGLFILTATHIVDSSFKVHDRFGLGFLIRWSLGYAHPNVLHISYLTFVLFLVYRLGRRFNLKWFAILMVGNAYVFLYSISATGLIAVTFYLLLCLYWYWRQKADRTSDIREAADQEAGQEKSGDTRLWLIEKLIIKIGLPVFAGLSLIAPLVLQGRAFDIVNKIVNTRLTLSKHFLTNHPFSLFGTRTENITTAFFSMDNSYLFAYVSYGAVLFAVILLSYFLLINRYCRKNKGSELCMMIASLAAGVTEPFLFNSSFKNVSLLFLGELIYNGSMKKEWAVLAKVDRTLVWILPDWNHRMGNIKTVFVNNIRKIVLLFSASFLAGAVIYGMTTFASQPDAIIIPRKDSDIKYETSIYLESPEQYQEENVKVLNYVDQQTEMIYFEGNIVKLEWVRGIITSAFLTGVVAVVTMLLIISANKTKTYGINYEPGGKYGKQD